MIIAFKIIILLVIVITLIGVIGEKEDISLRNNCTAICIAGIAAFVISEIYL